MLNIGFDVSVLRNGVASGIAVYTFHLVAAVLDAMPDGSVELLFGARRSPAADAALDALRARGAAVRIGPRPWRWSPDAAWWLGAPPVQRFLRDLDVFHAGEFLLPRRMPTACVATVHDVTTLLYPRHHAVLNRRLHTRRLRWAHAHADRLIAVSQATRSDLLRLTSFPPERIDHVPEARPPHAELSAEREQAILHGLGIAGRRYVLTVGTLEPRKNHGRLVQAFEMLDDPDVLLVLAGGRGWRFGETRSRIEKSPAADRIRVLGAVSAETLSALYSGATAFAYPSLYEGFGLPLLEAMGRGVPVLTSAVSSMPEVAGDAAVFVDPTSVSEIRDALRRVLDDDRLRSELVERGRRRAASFSWQRTAHETLAVYRRAIDQRARGGRRGAP